MPVIFDEPTHTYTSHENEVYTSVTTLIKKYVPPFDKDYWSAYKALKAVLESKGIWHEYKEKAGGWENVVAYARHIDKSFPYRAEVVEMKKKILQSWDDNTKDALTKGTIYHAKRENSTIDKAKEEGYHEVLQNYDFNDLTKLPDGSYPEMLLYNDKWKIAGQADLVVKTGKKVDIVDYKTSKSIERKAFQDMTLYPPVSHLPNANYYIYSLQLSIYARMLEQAGCSVGSLSIEHVDRNTHQTIEIHTVNYYRDEVNELIKNHIKSVKKNKT